MTSPAAEAARRRTFAIISHPDAGKTTLTEKFLLYGGALTTGAGAVKARGDRRSAMPDKECAAMVERLESRLAQLSGHV